jgi:hypothetical protein
MGIYKRPTVFPGRPRLTDNELRRLKQFDVYREEDRHESNLISGRLSSLLLSQTLLATVAAVVSSLPPDRQTLIPRIETLIAVLGFAMACIASIGICIGCRILHAWHEHGRALREDDKDELLKALFLDREMPDLRHKFSVELLNLGIPVLLGTGWLLLPVLVWSRSCATAWACAAGAVFLAWIVLLVLVWILTGRNLQPTPGKFKLPPQVP